MSGRSMQIMNQRQMAWLTCSMIAGGGLISIQQELARISHTDAWFSYLLPLLYVFFISYVFMQMSLRFPGKHMFEVVKIVFGLGIGTIVNLLLVIHLWLILMRDLRSLGKWIGTILLPNTPQDILVLLFMLMLMFYGKTSVEVIARVNDLFIPFFIGLALLLPFLLANELSKELIQPVLTVMPVKLFYSNALNLGWYGDVFVIGAFLHTIGSAKQIHSSIRHGAVLGSALSTLNMALEISVLGPNIPGNMVYPVYSMVQHIHMTDFLDRVDLIVLSIWFPITACKVVLIYLAFLNGISSLLGYRDNSLINSPVSLFLLLTSVLAFNSTTEIYSFGNFSSAVIVLAYQPVLFIILLLLLLRHPKTAEQNPSDAGSPEQGKDRAGPSGGRKGWVPKISYNGWISAGNVLLVLSLGFVIMGLVYSSRYAAIGLTCGIGYVVCMALTLVSSHMELVKTQKNST